MKRIGYSYSMILFFLLLELDHELELNERLAQRPNVQLLQQLYDQILRTRLFGLSTQLVRRRVAYDVQQVRGLAIQRGLEQLVRLKQVVAFVKATLADPVVFANLLQHGACKLIQLSFNNDTIY